MPEKNTSVNRDEKIMELIEGVNVLVNVSLGMNDELKYKPFRMIFRILAFAILSAFGLKSMTAYMICSRNRVFSMNTVWMQITRHPITFANINYVGFTHQFPPIGEAFPQLVLY